MTNFIKNCFSFFYLFSSDNYKKSVPYQRLGLTTNVYQIPQTTDVCLWCSNQMMIKIPLIKQQVDQFIVGEVLNIQHLAWPLCCLVVLHLKLVLNTYLSTCMESGRSQESGTVESIQKRTCSYSYLLIYSLILVAACTRVYKCVSQILISLAFIEYLSLCFITKSQPNFSVTRRAN